MSAVKSEIYANFTFMIKSGKIHLLLATILIGFASCNTNENQTCDDLNFQDLIQPVPKSAKFSDDGFFTWGAGLVKSKVDKKYHLFYSRWPHDYGFRSWVSHSEIAHAVSDSPYGPFKFKDVALPPRDPAYWDGLVTHNPNIKYFNGKYYLYYMGNTGDGLVTDSGLNFVHRNNQRIGVAVADDPNGPWERFDKPIIDVSPDSTAHDALMTSNPSVAQMPDGRFLMVYKAVGKKNEMPFGGPVVHLAAFSDSPIGPFIKQSDPIFTSEKNEFFPAEDPYIWSDNGCIYAIIKDQGGYFWNTGRSLILFKSTNGLDWKLAKNPLVYTLELNWENGAIQKMNAIERPQLYVENGNPKALLVAVLDTTNSYSFNVQIPLKQK